MDNIHSIIISTAELNLILIYNFHSNNGHEFVTQHDSDHQNNTFNWNLNQYNIFIWLVIFVMEKHSRLKLPYEINAEQLY